APAAVCLLWTRVRGPRPVRALARVALLGGSQLVAVLLVAALINDYGLFYRNWSELASGITQLAGLRTARDPSVAGPSAPVAERLLPSSQPGYRDPRRWNTTGRLEAVTIRGRVSGLSEAALVYLPPQYFQPAYAGRYFPAVEVFTGYPGIDAYLVSRLKYPAVLLHLIQ